ncbi:conjugal transfer protein TraN [Enterobacter hormaechei]|nr:conjugal transfer protein TraN [Enterobacter hormaechei]MDV5555431.1 conjugal transfer protein TraN [Enterobacter hormaechei]
MNAKRALKNCTYVGSYCKSKVLGACIEKEKAYCCFNSPLSRIIQVSSPSVRAGAQEINPGVKSSH